MDAHMQTLQRIEAGQQRIEAGQSRIEAQLAQLLEALAEDGSPAGGPDDLPLESGDPK